MERGAWTDQRLDDFSERVDLRFDALDHQMRDGFARVDRELVQIRTEMAGIHSTLHRVGGGIMVGLIGVIAAVLASG